MPAATPNELQPLSEAEKTRCIEAGTAFFGLHVWQGAELHVVHPPTSTGKGDTHLLLLGGGFFLMVVGLLRNPWGLLYGPVALFIALTFWNLFAKGRSSWTLRMQSKGFVYTRSGRWFPYKDRIRRGSLAEVSAIQRPSAKVEPKASTAERCRLWIQLGRERLRLPAQPDPQAALLEAIWSQHLGGTVADALPSAARAPAGMGHLYVSDRRPHGARVYAGQARLAPDAPERSVFVHLGHNLWGARIDRYTEVAARLERVAAAGLPHVCPALAVVVLDRAPAVLSARAEGLDLHQIIQRHGAMPASVCLELAARLAETIAAASVGRDAQGDPLPGHGRLESGMVLLDSAGTLSILEYAIQPAPSPPDQALFSFGSLPRIYSPEYLNRSAPTDDRYALGLMLLELLGGRPPFWDTDTLELLQNSLRPERQRAMVQQLVRDCAGLVPPGDRELPGGSRELSPGIQELVCELLAFAPTDRPAPNTLAARCRQLATEASGPRVEDWVAQHDLTVPVERDDALCGRVHMVQLQLPSTEATEVTSAASKAFDDPVAERTDWTPAAPPSSPSEWSLQAFSWANDSAQPRLKTVNAQKRVLASSRLNHAFVGFYFAGGLLLCLAGVLMMTENPVSATNVSAALASLLVGGAGVLLTVRWGPELFRPCTFDQRLGSFWKGHWAPPEVGTTRVTERHLPLSEIHAIQLIRQGNRSSPDSCELNLVRRDASRVHVVRHGKVDALRHDAAELAAFLGGVPVWDAM